MGGWVDGWMDGWVVKVDNIFGQILSLQGGSIGL